MLRKLNYRVASVSSGEEAVAYLKEHEVDLLVLDMIMDPGMDGLDTYKSVLEIHPETEGDYRERFFGDGSGECRPGPRCGRLCEKALCHGETGTGREKELDRIT